MNNGTTGEVWSAQLLQESRYWLQKGLLPCVVLVGLLGNILSIVVLTRKRMRSSTNVYLTALAVSDILILVFHLYLSFENYEAVQRNVQYITYWEYWRFALWLDDAALGISVWLTVSFTCERYIAVCHPLKGKVFCTESRAKKIIALVFLICPLSLITTPFEHKVEISVNNETNRLTMTSMSDLRNNPIYKTVFFWFIAIFYVFVPLLILAVLNSLLISAVRKSRRRRTTLTQAKYQSVLRQRQENKITMTLVAVVFLFLVCQTPQTVILVIDIFYVPPHHSTPFNLIRVVGNISNLLLALNAASNFILYCVMSDQYRRTLVLTFFPAAYRRKMEAEAALRSDASFRMTSMRNSSFNKCSVRSDHRGGSFGNDRTASPDLGAARTGAGEDVSLIRPAQRRVSLSPYPS